MPRSKSETFFLMSTAPAHQRRAARGTSTADQLRLLSETAMNEGYGSERGRRGQFSGGGGSGYAAIAAILALNVLAANVSAFVPPLSSSVRGECHNHEREREREEGGAGWGTVCCAAAPAGACVGAGNGRFTSRSCGTA